MSDIAAKRLGERRMYRQRLDNLTASSFGVSGWRFTLAVFLSNVESVLYRASHWPPSRVDQVRGEHCPLCGATLGPAESRPPRPWSLPSGSESKATREGNVPVVVTMTLPEERLRWRKCSGCAKHQVGVKA